MKFYTSSNIVPLCKGIIFALQPFAKSNLVSLNFKSDIGEIIIDYHPESIIQDVSKLLCNIIAFTPQTYVVTMHLSMFLIQNAHYLKVEIYNDGADLSQISQITNNLTSITAVSLNEKGTLFKMLIPVKKGILEESHNFLTKTSHYRIPPYYAQIKNKLRSHFANIENIENSATLKGNEEGVFLKKLNSIILANLDNENFNPDELSKALALSRTQLYRKLRKVTHIPPAKYIKFFRLQKAKEFLQNTKMNIGEVAFKVGFISNSHFTRAFHDQFGINPSFLKKQNSKIDT